MFDGAACRIPRTRDFCCRAGAMRVEPGSALAILSGFPQPGQGERPRVARDTASDSGRPGRKAEVRARAAGGPVTRRQCPSSDPVFALLQESAYELPMEQALTGGRVPCGACRETELGTNAMTMLDRIGDILRAAKVALAEAPKGGASEIRSPGGLTTGDDAGVIMVAGSPGRRVAGSPGRRVAGSPASALSA